MICALALWPAVIVNESYQTTVEISDERCKALSSEAKTVVFAPNGAYIGGDDR